MARQFQGSLAPLQDLETKAARPAKNSVFSGGEDTPASQGPADPSPLMIAMRNVAAIWLVALIAYAVIASLV